MSDINTRLPPTSDTADTSQNVPPGAPTAGIRVSVEQFFRETDQSMGLYSPARYPRYVPIIVVSGVSVSLFGFVLSMFLNAVWPVAVLVLGLAALWLGSIIARRAENRRRHSGPSDIWYRLEPWNQTKSAASHRQADHMSQTL